MEDDLEPCKYCGRLVLAGPACCWGMAQDMKAYWATPEYVALVDRLHREGAAAKAQRKAIKRQCRLDKLRARGYDAPIDGDKQDQARANASAWEGMIDRRE